MDTLENSDDPKDFTADEFPWRESDLAKKFGKSVAQLVALRAAILIPNEDWAFIKQRVHYTTFAAKKTGLGALGLLEEDLEWLTGKPPEEPVHTFKVYPLRTLNRFILLATSGKTPSGAPVLVRVRVKDKTNFRPGMVVRSKHVAGDLYELVGRCPRLPGKY